MVDLPALIATLILLVLSAFQIALAAGAPLGHFAWGGHHRVLPVRQRTASVSALAIYALVVSFVAQSAGWTTIWPEGRIEPTLWIITCYLAVSVGLNAMSKSRAERLVMTPVAAVLTALFLTLVLS